MGKKAAGIVFLLLILGMVFSFSGCSGTKGAVGPTGATGGYVMQFQDGLYPAASYAGCGAVGLDAIDLTTNYYSYEPFNVGSFPGDYSRFLIKFDLTSVIPSGVKVTKAYLTINITGTVGANGYALYPMTRNFLATAANWGTANGVLSWTNQGGDFSSTAVSENFYVQAGDNGKLTYTLDPALVQGWIADYTTNNGVILKATFENTGSNNITINTNQCPTFSQRPMLTVYYMLP
jgi:hypothetical protein